MSAEVVSVSTSEEKGIKKVPVKEGLLVKGLGIEGDAHAGNWHRQVSLLGIESIQKMRTLGADVGPGDFAENITTRGIELFSLPVGTKLIIGKAILEVSQIGKVCDKPCEIFKAVGDCIMPREGIFAKVIKGGRVKEKVPIHIESEDDKR